jgi:predicted O-methyltransferase YrrM
MYPLVATTSREHAEEIDLIQRAQFARRKFLTSVPRNAEEATRQLSFGGLHYRNQYYYESLPVYLKMVNLALHHGCRNILELGAGLSTALWANYATRTNATITTIDADFMPMRSYIPSREHAAKIDERVRLVQGVTITADQLRDHYESGPRADFGGVPANAVIDAIEAFVLPMPEKRVEQVTKAAGSDEWTMRQLFLDRKGLVFPKRLLDSLSPSGRFAKDVAFLEQFTGTVFDSQIDLKQSWDLIFFDSGEVSSAVEWLLLKDRIAVGGLAAFHDIFFPKSIKNFVVCAAIAADPKWRIVLFDDSTIQGLLIAQRIA